MNKWRIIRNIGGIVLFVYLIPLVYWLVDAIWHDVNNYAYSVPGPALYTWHEIFVFNSGLYLMCTIVPVIIIMILIMISTIKLKNNK